MSLVIDAEPVNTLAMQSLGHIAVHRPGATAVLRRHKLDFCCGGQVSLADAARQKGLSMDALVAELEALPQGNAEPDGRTPGELVDHILVRYHAVHREQLPELIRMARRVQAVHREHPEVPRGLAELLETIEHEMLAHMSKEEMVLFPALRRGPSPMLAGPIGMMRHEHVDHGAQLEQLARLTRDHTPPADACNTWRALYAGTRQFSEDLIAHIHLENNLLFPMFESACGNANDPCGCA
ncbi:MAG TPA: iron-sulfur cluster repair protein YtfE [Hydrogenophaga sp.]|uniref:iron-sulfur cluster repair protein YtfE n=1 Tax=Hydrogenophaga sp. TaxID=1904254 RepID=UPI002D152888|nr:iron-sulfur cluster repair protein YtfE [Hydrogenophaga sp.]HSX93895.1 iron-sulfur cluster repair protein YtfE [Hydrogenophaga sp.]